VRQPTPLGPLHDRLLCDRSINSRPQEVNSVTHASGRAVRAARTKKLSEATSNPESAPAYGSPSSRPIAYTTNSVNRAARNSPTRAAATRNPNNRNAAAKLNGINGGRVSTRDS
jgi:hypothetical protein